MLQFHCFCGMKRPPNSSPPKNFTIFNKKELLLFNQISTNQYFFQTIKKIDLYIWKKRRKFSCPILKSISTHWHNNNAQKMAEVAILHSVSSHLSLIRHHGRREWQNRYKTSPKAFPHSNRFTDLIGYQLDRHRVFNKDTKTDYESILKLMFFFFLVCPLQDLKTH